MTLLTPTILLLGWSIWATVRWAHEHPDDDARQEILRAILRRLAETATDELIQGLVLAAERRIIPNIRDRIEETIAAVRRAPTTSHHCCHCLNCKI